MEIHELPDKEFKIALIKMHNELRKIMHEQNAYSKEIENIKENQTEFWI